MKLSREIYEIKKKFYLENDSWPRLFLEKSLLFHIKKNFTQKNMKLHGNFSNIVKKFQDQVFKNFKIL